MNLIKKTIILTDSDAEGYVSVIRVGTDVGAKIVGVNFKKGMYAGLKIGSSETIYAVLDGEKTEITLDNVSFRQNDSIGCVITDGEKLVARGGNGVKAQDVNDHFLNAEKEPEAETIATIELFPDETDETAKTKTDETAETDKPTSTEKPEHDENSSVEDKNDETKKESLLQKLSINTGGDFYNGIREKLDDLFVIHPSASHLNELIPNSEWIKINYDGDDYYVVGKLKENNRTVLIGYGVPGKKTATPPKIADEIASYLAVDGISPYDGYWLIFQDANTGKIIKAE